MAGYKFSMVQGHLQNYDKCKENNRVGHIAMWLVLLGKVGFCYYFSPCLQPRSNTILTPNFQYRVCRCVKNKNTHVLDMCWLVSELTSSFTLSGESCFSTLCVLIYSIKV